MAPTARRQASRCAFTLIELLMVIMIIGLLAAILLPAIGGALQFADNVHCRNNLKGLALAVLSYTTDFQGAIPPTRWDKTSGDRIYWCNILAQRDISAEDTKDTDPAARTAQKSVLICPASTEQRVRLADAFATPDDAVAQGWHRLPDEMDVPVGTATIRTDGSYFWNGYAGTDTVKQQRFPSRVVSGDPNAQPTEYHNLSEMKQPSATVMLTDGEFFFDDTADPNGKLYAQRIAARHPGDYGKRSRTNIVFYDGHADSMDRGPDPTSGLWMGATGEVVPDDSPFAPIMTRAWDPLLDEVVQPYFMLPRR